MIKVFNERLAGAFAAKHESQIRIFKEQLKK